jgi:serine/threonine protein kinase
VGRETVDVAPLADAYQIIGELRGGRLYFARRRDDRTEVIVRVVRSSDTGGNNALAHLASDVQLLRTLSHPHMPRVLDGRWLGTEAFAVVGERIYGTTVQEILDRGERFTNPRIASLLEDVYAVVGWARAHGVVHRGVAPDSIIIERDTSRLFVTLGPTPIPITGIPGEAADARTIGRLAWTLLSGSPPDLDAESSLAELCPNLAARVVDETEKFVRLRDDADAPDVGHFIGIVAAGDVLKQAEIELAAAKDEYVEWRESEIQKYEAQRVEL